jgi:hypothetical protein
MVISSSVKYLFLAQMFNQKPLALELQLYSFVSGSSLPSI